MVIRQIENSTFQNISKALVSRTNEVLVNYTNIIQTPKKLFQNSFNDGDLPKSVNNPIHKRGEFIEKCLKNKSHTHQFRNSALNINNIE